MSYDFTVKTDGLANVIVRLNKLDPGLRREIQKQMKDAGSPLVSTARSLLPAASPLDNWGSWPRGTGGYNRNAASRGIKVAYKGSSESNTIPLLTFTQTNAGGAIFDMAGRSFPGRKSEGKTRGREMVNKLSRSAEGRKASRSMYPAVFRNLPKVFDELEQAIAEVEQQFRKAVYDLV